MGRWPYSGVIRNPLLPVARRPPASSLKRRGHSLSPVNRVQLSVAQASASSLHGDKAAPDVRSDASVSGKPEQPGRGNVRRKRLPTGAGYSRKAGLKFEFSCCITQQVALVTTSSFRQARSGNHPDDTFRWCRGRLLRLPRGRLRVRIPSRFRSCSSMVERHSPSPAVPLNTHR